MKHDLIPALFRITRDCIISNQTIRQNTETIHDITRDHMI